MQTATRQYLAQVAREKALLPFHGYLEGKEPNIEPIVSLFPKWSLKEVDRLWCAAFVYYCCIEAGFKIPYSPDKCVTCSLAGCGSWEEFAMGDNRVEYHRRGSGFVPEAGDIVIYDRVFINREHDHIGIVLKVSEESILAAEGNIFDENVSGLVERARDEHIRAFIRLPDGFVY